MAVTASEIEDLRKAIATGATSVRHGDVETRYDSFEKMVARYNWLLNQQSVSNTGPRAGFAAFDRGDNDASGRRR